MQSDQQNAFCLPGGEIVVYTGILPVTQDEAGLATVLGHEIAHATSRHGAQRIFQQNALQIALSGVQGSIADLDDGAHRRIIRHYQKFRLCSDRLPPLLQDGSLRRRTDSLAGKSRE